MGVRIRGDETSGPMRSIADQKLLHMISREIVLMEDVLKTIYTTVSNAPDLTGEELKRHMEQVLNSKNEIDLIKRDLLNYVSKISPSLYNREDWIRVIAKINDLADKSGGAMIRLEYIISHKWPIPETVHGSLSQLTGKIVDMTKTFRAIVNMMEKDPGSAYGLCREAEDLEHEIDGIYRQTNFRILESNTPVRGTILLMHISEILEDISDTIRSIVDDLRIILMAMA